MGDAYRGRSDVFFWAPLSGFAELRREIAWWVLEILLFATSTCPLELSEAAPASEFFECMLQAYNIWSGMGSKLRNKSSTYHYYYYFGWCTQDRIIIIALFATEQTPYVHRYWSLANRPPPQLLKANLSLCYNGLMIWEAQTVLGEFRLYSVYIT